MKAVSGYKYASMGIFTWFLKLGLFALQHGEPCIFFPDMVFLLMIQYRLEKTALVLCDVVDEKSHELAPHAPRSILGDQIKKAKELDSYIPMAAFELEYYLYQEDLEKAKAKNYIDFKPVGWIREDYHILQGTREEYFHGQARRHLEASRVPVENSKGEYSLGQHELNVRYADILEMADFTNSDEFRWFLGGWMKHTPDMMVFYAPTINSYKCYTAGSFAPTQIESRQSNCTLSCSWIREVFENRMPITWSRLNPYLAFAAALASGLDGIKNKIEPPKSIEGNVYLEIDLSQIPKSLVINCFCLFI